MKDKDKRQCNKCGDWFDFWDFSYFGAEDPKDKTRIPDTRFVYYCHACWEAGECKRFER